MNRWFVTPSTHLQAAEMEGRRKERLGAGELPQFVDYKMKRAEIDTRRIEMARVARRSTTYHSSLPEYDPNRVRMQELDVLHVEEVLTTSYPQETRDMSSRRALSFYLPPPMSGRHRMMSTTPLLTVDASNCVHNTFDGSYKPTRRNLTYSDEIGVDYDKNTKATSVRRVPTYPHHPSTFQPAVDASNRVHNMFDGFHKPVRRKSTRFDDLCVDHHENGMDTSCGRGSPFLPAVDVSKHVHNASDDPHNLIHRCSTHFDAREWHG